MHRGEDGADNEEQLLPPEHDEELRLELMEDPSADTPESGVGSEDWGSEEQSYKQ